MKAKISMRLLGTHRRLAGLEELDDLDDQRLIAAVAAAGGDPLGAEDGRAVVVVALAKPAERADPAPLPDAGGQVGPLGLDARQPTRSRSP